MKKIFRVDELDVKLKTVFLRIDANVPMDENGKIADDTRLQGCLETLEYLMSQEARVVLASHFGRPDLKSKDSIKKHSLVKVGQWFQEKLDREVFLVEPPYLEALKNLVSILNPRKEIILLENLRFLEEELENDSEFAQLMSEHIDVYINDAFGVIHRKHMSVHALPASCHKRGMGFLIEKEITSLNYFLQEAPSEKWAILGGLKVSDKITLINRLMDKVDGLIIGGAMAYTFLKAQKKEVGKSYVEEGQISYAKDLLERSALRGKKIILPVDHVVSSSLDVNEVETLIEIPADKIGVDIGPRTVSLIKEALLSSKSVFWNGPLGLFEKPLASKGSFAVAEILSQIEAYTLVGGGDSVNCVHQAGFAQDVSHISTGGGATLEYLQEARLPGLEVLLSLGGGEL